MSWFDGLRHRLRTVLRPGDYARELDAEVGHHLELDAAQQGDKWAARRRFGNRAYFMEEARRETWLRHADVLRQDLGTAWRALRRSPALTGVVVLTLALGIGANAATFTLLDRIFLRPPSGVHDPGALRAWWVQHFRTGDGVPFWSQSLNYPMYRALREAGGDASAAALYATDNSLRLGRGFGGPRVRAVYATASYFTVLGVRPAHGRLFTADEDSLDQGAPVAVVSDRFWRRHLDGDVAALGRDIELGTDRYQVIGVLPEDFTGLDLQAADVWIPLASIPVPPWVVGRWYDGWSMYQFRAVQRWHAGADERAASARGTAALRALNVAHDPRRADTLMTAATGPLNESLGPARAGQADLILTRLMGVSVIVLLIAWANAINLLLARAVQRRREIALRLALGITRARLVRVLTLETVLLAAVAGLAALLAAWWGGGALRALLMPEVEWTRSALDGRAALFTALVALGSGLLAGLVPAVLASRPHLAGSLQGGPRAGVRHRSWLRQSLLVVQAALSVVLLVGATLFVRSLRNVQGLDLGYDAGLLWFGGVRFVEGEGPPTAVVNEGMRLVAARLAGRPGVEAVARAGFEPMLGFAFQVFFTERDSAESLGRLAPTLAAVSPGFFRAAGLAMRRGRTFGGADGEPVPEVVVNEAAARLLWPQREALGQCMWFTSRDSTCHAVVGVVEDARQGYVIEPEPKPQYYVPLGSQAAGSFGGRTIVVRAAPGAGPAVAAELESTLRRAFPSGHATATSMTRNLEPEYRPWRVGAALFSTLGLLALVVAVVGIYSTVSYGVSQRVHEFGVRIALGARLGDVLRQVVGEGLRTVALGAVLGVLLALAAGRLVSALLFGVAPNDIGTLAGAALVQLGVAAVAALVPARRAARVDPVRALAAD